MQRFSSSGRPKATAANAATTPDDDAGAAEEQVYLGRQPILDGRGALIAFELLFRSSLANFAVVTNDAEATAHVISRIFGDVGIHAALGGHTGYVNVDRTMLMSDIIELLPPERFVLEILETVEFDQALLDRCQALRSLGFRCALDDVSRLSPRFEEILPYIDIVKIDFLQCPRDEIEALVKVVKQHGKALLAEKIETLEDHEIAMRMGFEMFQGYYFAKPQVLSSRKTNASRTALLRLLVLLSGEPSIAEIEAELKAHPDLVVKLLRLLNSSAVGLTRTISSLHTAILVIGTRQVARWAQMLLFVDGNQLNLRADPLAELCGTRARFMELTANRIRPNDGRFSDTAFITGVLSLIYVLYGEATSDVVQRLPIDANIRRAVLNREGELGLLLNAAEATESGDYDAMSAACEPLPALKADDLAAIGLAAGAWYNYSVSPPRKDGETTSA
ncbi:EAL domain-containing protein [Pandoraea sp.]|uniref:EAL and HDOD domain-containing protein n=1 Tax=Pandoraea sp. TaxID=1883445 RepID=UPI0011FA41FB|nr:EAL domain-containing protein [Pandoraea sp.]TAL55957.1 MAG: EAL domain-containing protein [Pandoraea sp.]TAM20694.1 MAG: EAL domain-containing protein [Pandoraea sp.]